MMIKKTAGLILILYSTFVFFSCDSEFFNGKDGLSLVLVNKSRPFIDSLQIVIYEFEKKEGINVKIINLIENNQDIILDFILKNPDSADIIEVNPRNIELAALTGAAEPLPVSGVKEISSINRLASYNNLTVATPWIVLRDKLCINTKLIDTNRINLRDGMPWNEFITFLSGAGIKPGTRPLALDILDRNTFFSFFLYYAEVHKPGITESLESMNFSDTDVYEIFNSMAAFIKYSWICGNEEMLRKFAGGKAIAVFADELELFYIKSINPSIEIKQFELPAGMNNRVINFAEAISLSINTKSQSKDKSRELINFLADNSGKFVSNNISVPAIPSIYKDRILLTDFFHEALNSYLFNKYYYRAHFSGLLSRLTESARTSKKY